MSGKAPRRGPRWQALLQGTQCPVFVIGKGGRALFANEALERATGLPPGAVRGLLCRKEPPPPVDAPLERHVAHLLTPPADALAGRACQARRLLPGPLWVDVDFLPLHQPGEDCLILGRLRPLPAPQAPPVVLPERLMALRHARACEFVFGLLGPPGCLLQRQARLAAELSCPVLMEGGPGSGRATFARIVHFRGPNAERPLACLDCSRLPARAVLRLVCTERGPEAPAAFYLREPGLLAADAQARLADQLQQLAGPRIYAGCSSTRPPLLPALAEQLSVFHARLPALRDSPEALPRVVEWMLSRLNDEGGFLAEGLAPAALDVLRAHGWPGNLAELFAVLRAARLQAARAPARAGLIEREHLPLALRVASEVAPGPPRPLELERLLQEAERRLLRLALHRAAGNRTRAAELLSVSRARLLRRIEVLGLATPEEAG